MGPKIIGILFLVVVLGAALFFFRSGVVSKLSFPTNPFSSNSSSSYNNLSGSSSSVHSWQPDSSGGTVSPGKWTPSSSSGSSTYNPSAVNPQDIPKGFTASDLSPYFRKVRIGSVSPGSDFFYGQISLSANFSGNDSIDVTGWYFQANSGSQFVPRAVNVYDPSGLASESDILLKSGDILNIYSTQSAIGENLRLNKCIGYLENYNHFIPAIPLSCPYVDRSEVSGFSGECQDFILSLGSCKLPPANPNLPPDDYACRSYLNTINYKGCFDKHSNEADFLSHEWRAWIGNRFLDQRHDSVLLLDKKGLLVDTYSY